MSKILIGNLKPPIATTTNLGISKPDGTTIGINSEGTLSSLVKASGLNVTDTQGIVVPKVEELAQETTMQALIDAVANKVMNQLVSNSTLATTLADYVTKAMIKTEFEDSDETVPASSLVNQLNSDYQSANNFISNFCRASTIETGDVDNILSAGFYNKIIESNTKNGPGFYCYLLVLNYDNRSYTQVAFGYNTESIAIRYKYNNGAWGAWRTIK